MKTLTLLSIGLLSGVFSSVLASSVTVNLQTVSQNGTSGTSIGTANFKDTKNGLLITPQLKNVSPGIHGFHIHENASCANNAMAAGGHLDPAKTSKHLGPYNVNGHLGDLPAITADQKGNVTLPVLAPRLSVKQIVNHAIVLHAGGDNYSDTPEKSGGGGARVACGVFRNSR